MHLFFKRPQCLRSWYNCWGNEKVQPFKITRTEINLAGCTDGGVNILNEHIMHLLIRTKGNRMWICAPHGQTSTAYVTNSRKNLYVVVDTWVDTYYKSKSAARKNYKADRSMSRRNQLSKLVWEY